MDHGPCEREEHDRFAFQLELMVFSYRLPVAFFDQHQHHARFHFHQVVGPPVERRKSGELGDQVGMDQLEETFGSLQVLEPVLAQVGKGYPVGQLVDDQRCSRSRQQYLSAVSRSHDPGGAVHDRPEVVAATSLRFTGVKGHAHAKGPDVGPGLVAKRVLGLDARLQGAGRRREHGHHPVARRLDHGAVGVGDRRSKDGIVALEGALHGVRELLPELRAALHVREQERQRRRMGVRGCA